MSIWGAALGFAGSLLNSRSRKKEAAKARAYNDWQAEKTWHRQIDMFNRTNNWNREQALDERRHAAARDDTKVRRLVADAKSAGIHPLAAMGVSGPGGGPIAQAVQPAQAPTPQTSPTGAGSAIGDGLIALGKSFPSRMQRLAETKVAAEIDVLRAQSRSILNKTALETIGATGGNLLALPDPPVRKPRQIISNRLGSWIKPDVRFTDAEDMERRYHELGGFVSGLVNLYADGIKNWFPGFNSNVLSKLRKKKRFKFTGKYRR